MNVNLLCLFENIKNYNELQNDLIKNLNDGNWQKNLESDKFKEFIINVDSESLDKDEKLIYAISCLLIFIQENFTGSNGNFNFDFNRLDHRWKNESLLFDGIEINSTIKFIELLLIAKNFLDDLIQLYPCDLLIIIWYMRLLKVHQSVLDENSITLYDNFRKIHAKLIADKKLEEIDNLRYRFIIELEIISIYLLYRRVYKVEELLNQLKINYKIETIEEGSLGMRTKWQAKALSQFHVSIKQENSELSIPSNETHSDVKLKLLELDDDTRLETIKFLDEKHNDLQHLSSMIQNFILIIIRYMEVSQPKDKLLDEEIQPYLMLLLKQISGPWSIRLNALMINIKRESNHRRTVERSLRQCEDIVNYLKSKGGDATATERLSYIFSSLMTPRYKIETQLADLMVSLGLIKGALDIYLQIHQWEDVINCYTRLQLRHKAAEIIRQELDKQPTAKLYCLLGDATDDVSFYEKAWEFSKHRSGLAQKHWAMYYFGKNDYENAIPHFQKSLEINSLQENLWLRFGYAALSLEKYELAASAYIRYTQLEPNGFESWNNLAKCFIELGDKKRAHKVLQESLKCNYDNWKIWENFLLVSVDIGSFEDALNACNRLIELKEKFFDEEVLKILIKAISENLVDNEGNAASRLRKKALELLAHLASVHSTEGVIWDLSTILTIEPLKKAEKLQKAYRGYTTKSPDWSKDEEMGLKLIKIAYNICIHSLKAAEEFKENEKMLVLSQLSSARLTAQGCVKIANNNQWESCKEIASNINELLEKIVIRIKELK